MKNMNENTKLSRLEKLLDYSFNDVSLLKTALTHRSKSKDNNERLEFLGDALLEIIISDNLFKNRPDATEGDLTRLRATMVRGATLAILAKDIDLKDFIIVGSGELRTGGYQRESTLADAFEAIVAAIYLDSDSFDETKRVVLRIYESQLEELPPASSLKDSKTKLQEMMQSQAMGVPSYELLSISGPDHLKQFEVMCEVGQKTTIATGNSKKKAEQNAANLMLETLTNT